MFSYCFFAVFLLSWRLYFFSLQACSFYSLKLEQLEVWGMYLPFLETLDRNLLSISCEIFSVNTPGLLQQWCYSIGVTTTATNKSQTVYHPFFVLKQHQQQSHLHHTLIQKGKNQLGDCIIGADVKRQIIFSKDFWQSWVYSNGVSFNKRLQSGLNMALNFLINLL